MSGEDNRKVMDLIDENNKLKKSIYLTHTEGRNLENNAAEHEEQTSRNDTTTATGKETRIEQLINGSRDGKKRGATKHNQNPQTKNREDHQTKYNKYMYKTCIFPN